MQRIPQPTKKGFFPPGQSKEAGVSTLSLSIAVSSLLLAFIYNANTSTNQAIQFGSRGDIREELDNANRNAIELSSTLLASNQLQIIDGPGNQFRFALPTGSPGLDPNTYTLNNAGELTVSVCNTRLQSRNDPSVIVNGGGPQGSACGASFSSVMRVTDVREISEIDPQAGERRRVRFAMVEAIAEQDVSRDAANPQVVRSRVTARVARPANGNAECRFAQNPFYNELRLLPPNLSGNIANRLAWVGVYSFTNRNTTGVFWEDGFTETSQTRTPIVQVTSRGPYTPFDKYYDGDPNTLQFKLEIEGRKVYTEVTDVTDEACQFVMYEPRGNSFNGGCFVPETRITMADGRTKAISDIVAGERVFDPQDPDGKLITRLTRGLETKPLIVIKAAGRELVVTENHPIFTKRGLVAAQDLTDQDAIELPNGEWTPIATLERRAGGPEQWVYNLEIAGLTGAVKDHAVIAEGLVVGDHFLQRELE